eukprot:1822847-Amphidinium_carterae.1
MLHVEETAVEGNSQSDLKNWDKDTPVHLHPDADFAGGRIVLSNGPDHHLSGCFDLSKRGLYNAACIL